MKIETPIAKKKHRRIKSNSKNIDMAMDGGNTINDGFYLFLFGFYLEFIVSVLRTKSCKHHRFMHGQ